MNTATIDNTIYNADYLTFTEPTPSQRQPYWWSKDEEGAYWRGTPWVPSPPCYIHVWQKSDNLNEFEEKMEKVWNYFVEKNKNRFDFERHKVYITSGVYDYKENKGGCIISSSRGAAYRRKGVAHLKNLKYLPDPDKPQAVRVPWNKLDYEALNLLAEESLQSVGCPHCGHAETTKNDV